MRVWNAGRAMLNSIEGQCQITDQSTPQLLLEAALSPLPAITIAALSQPQSLLALLPLSPHSS